MGMTLRAVQMHRMEASPSGRTCMGMLTMRAVQMRRMEASPSGRSAGQAEESATSSLTASTPLQRLALQPARSPPRPARLMLDLATHFFFKVLPSAELMHNPDDCQCIVC